MLAAHEDQAGKAMGLVLWRRRCGCCFPKCLPPFGQSSLRAKGCLGAEVVIDDTGSMSKRAEGRGNKRVFRSVVQQQCWAMHVNCGL